MAFDHVDQLPDFPKLESEILQLWKDKDIFHKSLAESKDRPAFVFYEGPPTANGLPHNGHVLTRVMKDLWPRYQTMRGRHVERWAGWDTHGLPVEVEVEKELRIQGKQAILEYGVEKFSRRCLESVFRYTTEWEHMTERIGFWVDLDKAYVTFHKSYVESVWWALSRLFEEGLLYKGHKVVWWWAQGGTALSSGETGQGYKTVEDPSIYVKFPLVDEDASLVVWTTTPWTLPSNMFAAVHGELDYAYAKDEETGDVLVIAEGLRETIESKIGRSLTVQKTVKGAELFGKKYTPPFDVYAKDIDPDHPHYFRIVPGDKATAGTPQWFVTLDAGTGIVHVAPAFGEDDWKVWRNQQRHHGDIPLLCAVKPDGTFDDLMGEHAGVWVKDADKPLTRGLKERKLVLHAEQYKHEYPFCWRSDNDPLIQYARDAWFIRTTDRIDQVIENNQEVTWLPEHIKDGRFGDFLAGNVDWALSRERFWGTPLNIWECESCENMVAPSSCKAIEELDPDAFAAFNAARAEDPDLSEHLIVHKPWIDQVKFSCEKCGGTMTRVPEVIDCWFDSGCMPFAQFGYPHVDGSVQQFENAFPADFISEAVDQTRGWFYSLMMISNLLFKDKMSPHPYKRCIVLGLVCDKDGKKESKSKGNYTPPEVILDKVRMEFAYVEHDKLSVKPGEALIAIEDLEGLDLRSGAKVRVYREDKPDESFEFKLKGHPNKKEPRLPRRQVILHSDDAQKLGLAVTSNDIMAREVPNLEAQHRVTLEDASMPAPGADAFRWFFYASNPPWNNTRHSLTNVRGLQKELPIKLRSIYAFFVTYANIDNFHPVDDEKYYRAPKERALLDRWILSELERTKKKFIEHMDAFNSYEAAQTLNGFVEALSNWYVRRSRVRFWADGREQDKLDAYWTLYKCLRDTALYAAPFIPFGAEDIYQNLVVSQYGDGPAESVHLCLMPTPDESLIDTALSETMADVRALVSLGLKVRTDNKLKVRQPLASVEVILADPDSKAHADALTRKDAIVEYASIMSEELNVKNVALVDDAAAYVDYRVKANFKALGKRLGKKMKATAAAIKAADPNALKKALDEKGTVSIDVDGESVALDTNEIVIEVAAKEGFAAAGASIGVVVLDTKITEELAEEGLFREVLSKIQNERKVRKLDYQARIKLHIAGDPAVIAACESRVDDLKRDVLASEVVLGSLDEEHTTVTTTVDKKELQMTIEDKGVPSGIR